MNTFNEHRSSFGPNMNIKGTSSVINNFGHYQFKDAFDSKALSKQSKASETLSTGPNTKNSQIYCNLKFNEVPTSKVQGSSGISDWKDLLKANKNKIICSDVEMNSESSKLH